MIEFQGKKWVREGHCIRCGRCCFGKAFVRSLMQDGFDEAVNQIGHILKIGLSDMERIRCGKIKVDKTFFATCKIHGERPKSCIDYPMFPTDIIKGCGYKFKEEVKGV